MDVDNHELVRECITIALKGHVGTANVSLLLQEGERGKEKKKNLEDFFALLLNRALMVLRKYGFSWQEKEH